jgi:hypothetical protein
VVFALRCRGARSLVQSQAQAGQCIWSEARFDRAPEINRESGPRLQCLAAKGAVFPARSRVPAVKVCSVAPLRCRRHPAPELRLGPFDPVSQKQGIRQKALWQVASVSFGK